MKSIHLLFLMIVCLFFGCSKMKEPEPPIIPMLTPMTTEGKETLSFLKDGEVWIADKDALSPVASIGLGSKQLSVSARKKWPVNQQEMFNWSFPLLDYEKRKYNFSNIGGGFFPEYDLGIYCFTEGGYKVFATSQIDSFNFIDITHIEWAGNFNIISGTFQFRLTNIENEECHDTIYITDGRFDLEFDVKP